MKRPAGWEKRILITLFITLSLSIIFMIQTPAMAFGPQIVDVTTKAFSVVWTTGGTYTSCDIVLYDKDHNLKNLDSSQKIIETSTGFPGEDGKQYGLAKVTVVGLEVNTLYYFRLKQNGNFLSSNYSPVTTANLRGFSSTDPNNNDLVSNDIVHKAVYKSNGTSPATGALVLAYIYDYTVDPVSDPDNTKSYYPISAWVGDGMIGDEDDDVYNPNNISYKQYAALNMNNLFEKTTPHYPLSLNGDDPGTPTNDSEIIKFIIVHGTQSILGDSTDTATSYGRVEYVEKSGGEKITTAKISASFRFNEGVSVFTIPCVVPDGYSTGQLLLDIEEAEGKEDIVQSIYLFKEDEWKRTYTSVNVLTGQRIVKFSNPLQAGQGCYIIMEESMTNEITFYGKPNPVPLNLKSGVNLVAIPQLPVLYTTENLLKNIETKNSVPESVKSIYSFVQEEWKRTYTSVNVLTGQKIIKFPYAMTNTKFNYIIIEEGSPSIPDWNPF